MPVVRAAMFAIVGTVLGMSAHHLSADGPVPWAPGAVAAVVLFAVGLACARRPRSLAAVVAASAGGQAGLHLWLTLTTQTHHAAHMEAMGAGAHAAWHERLHDSAAMTAAHAIVAVLVAVLLHRADAVCWSLARGVTPVADAVRARVVAAWAGISECPVPVGQVAAAPIAGWLEPRPPSLSTTLADVVIRRGPPYDRAGFVI
ncbi:hypothetical protein ND808_43780 [Streptomyces sp. DR7-3]|uniref:hypothetical protein n=1 Tax=Streptomyces malaysiensis TaxID=92644 RepID=UPI0020432101|nr:hypothetical protein [Streptomyces sp. DR7-3]MCM3812666.1 hypothetical protein [Streptomyces sp. DR7-3]